MNRKMIGAIVALLSLAFVISGCGKQDINTSADSTQSTGNNISQEQDFGAQGKDAAINLSSKLVSITDHLSAVEFIGDDFFEEFLQNGGAKKDADVVSFLAGKLSLGGLSFGGTPFGCSTLAVESAEGERLFGRNFDWNRCDALIVKSNPESGYASISTVNTDFIQGIPFSALPDETKALIALYAPLDGMNEKGLVVSVNMISDGSNISQNTDKPDITTTTAIRLLLNKAATVEEAISLLQKYDFHASMNFMVHLAIADADGNSVVVEYIKNEMSVVETPIVTNFYLTKGEKYGIGTEQSHKRFEILAQKLKDSVMSMTDMRNALSSVSKGNFKEFESTEWSIVFNQTMGEVHYYHRENYENRYIFTVKNKESNH